MRREIKFTISRDEGYLAYQLLNVQNMASVLAEMDSALRALVKYDDGTTHEKAIEAYEHIREVLHQSCIEEGFTIDKLWE